MITTEMSISTRVNPLLRGDPFIFWATRWRSISGYPPRRQLLPTTGWKAPEGRSRSGGMESSKSTIRIGPLIPFPLDTVGLRSTRFPFFFRPIPFSARKSGKFNVFLANLGGGGGNFRPWQQLPVPDVAYRSSRIVTGPSFTSSTSIRAPKTPDATGRDVRAAREVTNSRNNGSDRSGGAAASKPGRFPFCASP